jgi:hypothetical protein
MANLIVESRDQKFVLYEMLHMEDLFKSHHYADFSKEMIDMVLTEAEKMATDVMFPTLKEGDHEGCKLENGSVKIPTCYRKAFQLYYEGGWNLMNVSPDHEGQGLPNIVWAAAKDWFMYNFPLNAYFYLSEGATHLIDVFGTEEQKEKYTKKMHTGQFAGTMGLSEASAGSDVGNLKTKAFRQPDGTYKLQGSKIFISGADQDIAENVVNTVLARIEGDPAGTAGISIFIMPKYLVNDDGSLGRRNDYAVASIEEKMGLHGSATCLFNMGDNNECYAELLGKEREGMRIMFQMMNESRIGVGLQGLSTASVAYLHSLQYAKERLQGSAPENMKDAEAPRVPIIVHPDVRRMLLWMKSHVDGFRAMMFYAALCLDLEHIAENKEEKDKWSGMLELLTPICKAYISDMAFKVTETAIQVYGGYGYCSEYPVEQLMRDLKIASIYEGTNGIQGLDLVGRKLGMKKGLVFKNLLDEMHNTVAKYIENPELKDLAADVKAAVNLLAELATFFAGCKGEKFLVPIANAYPFLMMMGKVVMGWMLLWEAGVAAEKFSALCAEKGIDAKDPKQVKAFVKDNQDAAFYAGKEASAKYFIKNVLPEIYAASMAFKNEDLSIVQIADESFAV